MITARQGELLRFIKQYCLENQGTPPSYDEMKEALNLSSKSSVNALITSLEARGYIRRIPYFARAIEIIRMP